MVPPRSKPSEGETPAGNEVRQGQFAEPAEAIDGGGGLPEACVRVTVERRAARSSRIVQDARRGLGKAAVGFSSGPNEISSEINGQMRTCTDLGRTRRHAPEPRTETLYFDAAGITTATLHASMPLFSEEGSQGAALN